MSSSGLQVAPPVGCRWLLVLRAGLKGKTTKCGTRRGRSLRKGEVWEEEDAIDTGEKRGEADSFLGLAGAPLTAAGPIFGTPIIPLVVRDLFVITRSRVQSAVYHTFEKLIDPILSVRDE